MVAPCEGCNIDEADSGCLSLAGGVLLGRFGVIANLEIYEMWANRYDVIWCYTSSSLAKWLIMLRHVAVSGIRGARDRKPCKATRICINTRWLLWLAAEDARYL